jgi:hypothetical protein
MAHADRNPTVREGANLLFIEIRLRYVKAPSLTVGFLKLLTAGEK